MPIIATYAGTASCTLDLYDTKLFNSNGDEINHQVEDGNYKFVVLDVTVATISSTYPFGGMLTVTE